MGGTESEATRRPEDRDSATGSSDTPSATQTLGVDSDTSHDPDFRSARATGTPTFIANAQAVANNASLPAIDTLTAGVPRVHIRTPSNVVPSTPRTPRDAGLHIQTHITTPTPATATATHFAETSHLVRGQTEGAALSGPERGVTGQEQGSGAGSTSTNASSNPIPIQRGGSLRSTLSATSLHGYGSAVSPSGSQISSPALNALADITPLPSPLATQESPKPWKSKSRPGSSGSLSRSLREEVLLDAKSKSSPTKTSKMKSYGALASPTNDGSSSSHKSNRSISEFQPGPMHNERQRTVTLGNAIQESGEPMQVDSTLHREKYLAEQRGLVQPPLPTPPASNRSVTESEAAEEVREEEEGSEVVSYLTVREGASKRKRKYRPVRPLGQGTFSSVVLATSEQLPASTKLDETSEEWLNPRNLVAIKVVQHGPAGGADADRIDLGLKREIEILRSLSHPTLIQLKAFDYSSSEALIVLNYCPGGDLFDLASQHRELLTPPIVQRMFAELVDAINYLHGLWIVHRDIKLENVLLNVPPKQLAALTESFASPYPLITLTDLGLSRKIPQLPESPLLQTRCGSEDYAAPEILLGQPYDGRKTDAWALGVLTYALMEGRLPFDPPPVRPGQRPVRSKASHRIARCDWIWCEYGDEDGEWDPTAGAGWEGAKECVEGLLKKVTRGRVDLDELAQKAYVKEALACEGGLRRAPHADDEEDAAQL